MRLLSLRVCLSLVSLPLLPYLFHSLPVLCPAHHLQCHHRRGLKLLRTRRMRSIAPWRFSILSQVQAHNESRSEKVGSSDASSTALHNTDKEQWKDPPHCWKRKTKYACVVHADESTRRRLEGAGHKSHQDHTTAKGMNSMAHYSLDSLQHCTLVHKFTPMPEAMKIPDARAAVEKECEQFEKIPAWQLTRSQKQERCDQ